MVTTKSHSKTSDFDEVKELARGQWSSIIGTLYPSVSKALAHPGLARCACPVHASNKGDRADGFRVFPDFEQTGGAVCNTCGTFPTGIDLICFLDGQEGNPKHGLEVLRDYFGISTQKNGANNRPTRNINRQKAQVSVPDPRDDPVKIKKRLTVLSRIWNESIPLSKLSDSHQAIRYFTETRGIKDQDFVKSQENMRFHPDLFYASSEQENVPPIKFPGIVSMMHRADGRAAALHRIFLDHHEPKKAPVEKAKKIIGRLNEVLNGAVRIHSQTPFSSHANVCEGIETGAAIAYSTGHPVYAAGYTTLVSSFVPPSGTRFVTIWADRDQNEAGLINAKKLKERLISEGYQARILLPNTLSVLKEDWNDVLIDQGYKQIANSYSGSKSGVLIY
jgi:hypothetical protein